MPYELYQVTNKINGRMYIGQTCQGYKRRWYIHCWKAARGGEQRFHQSIRKYGKENFEVKLLVVGPTLEWINDLEQKAIKLYDTFNNGYNDTKGGDGLPPTLSPPYSSKACFPFGSASLRALWARFLVRKATA